MLLQNPLFLETLVCWLFTPTAEARNDEAEDDLRNKSVELLGYSCSVTERLYGFSVAKFFIFRYLLLNVRHGRYI